MYKPKCNIIFRTRLELDCRWIYLTFNTILAAHGVDSVYILLLVSLIMLQIPASLSIKILRARI